MKCTIAKKTLVSATLVKMLGILRCGSDNICQFFCMFPFLLTDSTLVSSGNSVAESSFLPHLTMPVHLLDLLTFKVHLYSVYLA